MHKRIAIFVDGENFRNTLIDLFPVIKKHEWYLPNTNWANFLNQVASTSVKEVGFESFTHELMRCYWYVVGEFEHWNYFETAEFGKLPLDKRLEYFEKHASSVFGDKNACKNDHAKTQCADRCNKHLEKQLKTLKVRDNKWKSIQDGIQKSTNKLEFRRFGHIFVHLDKLKFHTEKGTDVKLALDLLLLKDTYDLAVLVSGDADYIPAVTAAKGYGKHVVNVDFLNADGSLLPGGARKLKIHCDATITIPFEQMKNLMSIQG